ncbi:MAG: hypothetical protein H7Y20_18875 [Bryobacteraceae bacterium]|nr:hypothetical protein [Bryobacteraceae bacterium]
MNTKHESFFKGARGLMLLGALLAFAPGAEAARLQLIYNGVFNTQNALNPAGQLNPTFFTAATPFTINAFFDTSSPNLAPPSPPLPPPFGGFRAYSPSLATITIGGIVYTVDTFTTNPTAGITVAIFDQNSFVPGRYGIGILQDPPADGAGIVGDFTGASPDYTAAAITPTVYTGYAGVGYLSGVCIQGTPGNCTVNAVTPLVLRDGANNEFALTLGNYQEDYFLTRDPNSANGPGPLNSAVLVAIPEPGTCALAGVSLALLLGFARRRLS